MEDVIFQLTILVLFLGFWVASFHKQFVGL
jgi:hypothetical protein